MGETVLCPYCGQEHPDTDRFCMMTGQPIPKITDCPNCSEPVEEGWYVCAYCGQPLKIQKGESRPPRRQRSVRLWIGAVVLVGVIGILVLGGHRFVNAVIKPLQHNLPMLCADRINGGKKG